MKKQEIIDKLKQMTRLDSKEGHDFSVSMDFFFTHIGEQEEFMAISKPLKKGLYFYKTLVIPVMNAKWPDVTIDKMQMLHIKKYRFTHGPITLSNGVHFVLYYFEDEHVGLACAAKPGEDSYTDFFRLSLRMVSSQGDAPKFDIADVTDIARVIMPATSDTIQ